MPSSPTAEAAAERVARQSYGKLVAFLAARSGDVASAEDALADAFAAALQHWPQTGPPDNPEAWLLTVARRRQIDAARRRQSGVLAEPHLQLIAEDLAAAEAEPVTIPDQRLALMFACAHPAIEPSARTPLILQSVLGFDAATIASAFLVSPKSMSQRLVRAKAKIKAAGIPFQIPEPEALPERLDAVLDAIYACFSDGWSDAAGSEPSRHEHSSEAIWLGKLVVSLLPGEPEALSLLALMLYSEARRAARRDGAGRYVPLAEQNPAVWNAAMVSEADTLVRAAGRQDGLGRFQLQAAIQAVHAARLHTERTDWPAIAQLYDALLALTGSVVVAINRAVAIAEARAPQEGLDALDKVATVNQVLDYQPYWAARAQLLVRCGNRDAADEAYTIASGLERDPAVRDFLQRQRQALRH
jgi:RNA polymerase sigma-70 factor, ECF subfamily